jgi:hypothetical protein
MFIKINKTSRQSITLDVHSYSDAEFNEVDEILSSYGVVFNSTSIAEDREGRRGKRFEIEPDSTGVFEKELNIEFKNGIPHFGMSGKPFSCKEISRGKGNGCETIYAKDKRAARLICSSYIAPKKGWFSSYPEEGECKKKGFFRF